MANWNTTGTIQVDDRTRFAFGRNWRKFLRVVTEERIARAVESLGEKVGPSLAGRSFVDVGSGSGLSSLAAVRLGAANVHSFDYDEESVEATCALKQKYCSDARHWTIERGSVLDRNYLRTLGQWDVVCSWGVLHHTGDMWQAMADIEDLVAPGGALFISIYNDQGRESRFWAAVKRLFNSGTVPKSVIMGLLIPIFVTRGFAKDVATLRNPVVRYSQYKRQRGMSVIHDWIDWLGGYPFEVAKPEEVFAFWRGRGFVLEKLATCGGGWGCNEFVFRRS